MKNRSLNPDKIIEVGGTQNMGDINSRLRSSKGMTAPFSRAIVYEYLGDISLQSDDELRELADDLGGAGYEALKRAPRNSIIATIIDGPDSAISNLKVLCYPFFSPHLAMPIKPGEQVWVYDASPGSRSPYNFWISRVHEPDDVDDVNYTHSLRRHDLYVGKSVNDQLAQEQGYGNSEEKFTGKKEAGETPGPPHFFDRPPDASPLEQPAIRNSEIEGNPNQLRLPISEAPSAFDKLVEDSTSYQFFTPEPVPRFVKRPGDMVFMGSNNSLICLGQDRGWNSQDRPENSQVSNAYRAQPLSYSGTVDIVAGRGLFSEGTLPDPDANPSGTQPRVIKNTRGNLEVDKNPSAYTKDNLRSGILSNREDRPVEGDPDFLSDASRIYVSMKTSPDINLGITKDVIHEPFEGTLDDIEDSPAVLLKSNQVRVVSRQAGSVRIIKEGNRSDDQASIYLLPEGIVQVSGEKIYMGRPDEGSGPGAGQSEPYIKYSEFKALLEGIIADITTFCNTLNTHTTPGFGAPSPQINVAATNLISAMQQRRSEIPNVTSDRIFGE